MKNRYDLETPDLTPDLEWMLSSKQVSSSLLLERLLEDHYSHIIQIAFSILDDRDVATRVAQDIIVRAMLAAHDYTGVGEAEVWLYRIAWKLCLKASQQRKARLTMEQVLPSLRERSSDETSSLEPVKDAPLWQAVDALEDLPRWILILFTLHGWPVETISQVVGVSQPEAQAALDRAWQNVGERWLEAGHAIMDIPEALLRLFSVRWPYPSTGDLDLDELSSRIGKEIIGRKRRSKALLTSLEVAFFALVVVVAGGFFVWTGRSDPASRSLPAVALQASPSPGVETEARSTPTSDPRQRSSSESVLMPRSYDHLSMLTRTPTPDGVLYASQDGEPLAPIARRLNVPLDELRRLNRLSEDAKFARGELLYIPGSLPELTPRYATEVPQPAYSLPLETPGGSMDIAKLMSPQDQTYHTVWFDAVLYLHPQLPFSDQQELLRIQLWLSEDEALLVGGSMSAHPDVVIMQVGEVMYVARPVDGNPWFQPADSLIGQSMIDPRLLYGAISLLERSPNYQKTVFRLDGEEQIAGRPSWKIIEINDQVMPVAEYSIDKGTGFILKYSRAQDYPADRENLAFFPQEAIISAIEFNVDFPQELFNPRLPWRGGYALDHTAQP